MPPAFVLSQDQTLKFDVRLSKGGIPSDNRSFQGAVPAQITYYCGYVLRHIGTACINRAPEALKPSDPGPPPTCPFIDNHNFKEPPTRNGGQLSFPAIAIGGHLSVSVGDRLERCVCCRAPSGEQASKAVIDSRQQPFCNFVSLRRRIGRNARVLRRSLSLAPPGSIGSIQGCSQNCSIESSRPAAKNPTKPSITAFDSPKISGCMLGPPR